MRVLMVAEESKSATCESWESENFTHLNVMLTSFHKFWLLQHGANCAVKRELVGIRDWTSELPDP